MIQIQNLIFDMIKAIYGVYRVLEAHTSIISSISNSKNNERWYHILY